MSERLKVYRLSDGYIQYLHKIDYRVQYNKGARRPYMGIVLEIGVLQYFVPMESPKPNHSNMKNGAHFMRIDSGKLGLLGFNNMVPAKPQHLLPFDIELEPDDQYKNLLRDQLKFCNANREEIRKKAAKTYEGVVKKKTPFLMKVCCDFSKLEGEYTKYVIKTT